MEVVAATVCRTAAAWERRRPRRLDVGEPIETGTEIQDGRLDDGGGTRPMAVERPDRIRPEPTFENDHRREIYRTVQAHPGLCLTAVGEAVGVSLSTVRHHGRVLADEGHVRSVSLYGKRRYFPRGMEDVERRAALSEPSKRRLLEVLSRIGPAHTGRIADELDRDASTVSHHLTDLEATGLVDRKQVGRTVLTSLHPDVETTLKTESEPSLTRP